MEKFEERQVVFFENEGEKIMGMLHKPLQNKKSPAVLMCHGFAGNKIGRYRLYVLLGEALAKFGIASLRFDFRGCGESEGKFSSMTVESQVNDALKGLEFLRKCPDVDPDRIAILGNSFGAAIAVLASERDQHIKSLVLLAALFCSDPWKKQWEALKHSHNEEANRELHRMLDGNLPGNEFFKQFFSLNVSTSLKSLKETPLLHIHSLKDSRVELEQAKQYEAIRQHALAESKWVRLEKCDHDFSNFEERNIVIEEVIAWLLKTL